VRPLLLRGKRPFSEFRLTDLSSQLHIAIEGQTIDEIDAHYVYLLECEAALSADVRAKAEQLLGAEAQDLFHPR